MRSCLITLLTLVQQDVDLTQRGEEWIGLCPFHAEHTPSFSLNESKGFYHCFGCGASGDAITWLRTRRGLSFHDAAQAVGKEIPASSPLKQIEQAVKTRLADQYQEWCQFRWVLWSGALRALYGEQEIAAIGLRATVRRPDLYDAESAAYWAGEYARITHAIITVEHEIELLMALTPSTQRARFAWWQEALTYASEEPHT